MEPTCVNGYSNFFFFLNMYIMPGEEIFLALWLLGPMAPSNAEFHRTQPLRKTWCCTSDTLRSVLAREYLDPSASGVQVSLSSKPIRVWRVLLVFWYIQWFYSASSDNISVWLLSLPNHGNVWSRCRTRIVYSRGKKILNRPMNPYWFHVGWV